MKHISIDGLGLLGVDNKGRLYVDGTRIATVNEFRLSMWQAVVAAGTAIVAAAATASVAVFDALRFFGFGHQ